MRVLDSLTKQVEKLTNEEFQKLYDEEPDEENQRELVVARCEKDFELYCMVYFPHYCNDPFNEFHKDYFTRVRVRSRGYREALAAPRGSAKSTFVSLIKCIHDVCYGLEKFIVIISNTAPLAERKLKDIRDEIIQNRPLADDFALRFARKTPAETQFMVMSGNDSTYFMAFGRGAQIRGVRVGPHRPSKVVCDDVEHSDEIHSETVRNKTYDWHSEDVAKVGDNKTSIEFVGTILHRDSLLNKLIRNPAYKSKTYKSIIEWSKRDDLWRKWEELYIDLNNPERMEAAQAFFEANKAAMLEGTRVMWPEREPYDYLMREKIEIGKRAFFKEKQNEPLGSADKVFEKIHWYNEVSGGLHIEGTQIIVPWAELLETAYGAMDPSTGQTKPKKGKLGDFTCILSGYHDRMNRVFIHHDSTEREQPSEYIKKIFEQHERFNYRRFGAESNLYRNILSANILEEKKKREKALGKTIKIEFYDIEQTENKHERIFRIEPKVTNGWILFNRKLSHQFKSQLEDFPHAEHDDAPDCLEMMWMMVNDSYKAGGVSRLTPMGNR